MNSVNLASNKYCGPAVISIITGLSTDEVEQEFQKYRNKYKPITTVYTYEMEAVLHKLGYRCINKTSLAGRSLYVTLTMLDHPGYYYIVIPGHAVCVELTSDRKRLFCDNRTKKPLNAAASAELSQRVLEVIYVTKDV